MMHGIHTLNLVFFQGVFLGVFREVVGGGGCFFFYKGEKETFGSFRVFLGQFESQVWGSPPPCSTTTNSMYDGISTKNNALWLIILPAIQKLHSMMHGISD